METERGRELSLHQSVTKSCEHVQLVVAILSNRVLFGGLLTNFRGGLLTLEHSENYKNCNSHMGPQNGRMLRSLAEDSSVINYADLAFFNSCMSMNTVELL